MKVWRANRLSVSVFTALATQWRFNPAGSAVGLDYGVITPVMELLNVPQESRRLVFSDLVVMEDAALSYFAQLRARNAQ